MKLEIIPEYNEVGKLFLSFENDFFNSRFKYGKTIAEITKAVNLYEKNVQIEIFVKPGDEDILACEFEKVGLDLFSSAKIILKYANSITSSVIPVFAKNQDKYYGITHNILRNKFGSDLENSY